MEAICRRTGVDLLSSAVLPAGANVELGTCGEDDAVRFVAETDGATTAPV